MRLHLITSAVLAASAAWGQSSSASLTVVVTGIDGAALPGVVVSVKDEARNLARTLETGAAGTAAGA